MQLLTRKLVLNLTKNITQSRNVAAVLTNHSSSLNNGKSHLKSSLQNYSSGPTNSQNLLKFPAFPLNETLNRFIKTTEPLLSEFELKETRKEVEKFLNGDGAKLQNLLVKRAENENNWLAERWLKTAYLQYRDPVVVFSSPGMTFPTQQFTTDDDFLRYAAQFIFGTLKYKELVDQKKIPVQKMGKLELDNSQFGKVFGTCRIPGVKEDNLEYYPNSKHVTVIYKNHFYKLPVYAKANQILHPDAIFKEIKDICMKEQQKGELFGLLSSDNRDNWGQAYQELISIAGNKESVREIQKSLFTVSLDQEVPVELGKNDLNVASEQLIHGGGSQQNGANRWFDKTIQVIINRNGVNGFCYEHSPAEGQPIALMTDYIVQSIKDENLTVGSATDDYEKPQKLHLKSSPNLEKFIEKSKENIDKLACDLHMRVLHYKGYGKGFLKSQKLSPDSFIQMAIQFAFYKLHKVPGTCYESAHLRIYDNGRTETIRSCSNESVAFAKAMTLVTQCKDTERVELLRKAVAGHREYTNLALQGRGVDRHLLGLKLMAIENNLPIPTFYKTPAFVKSAHFRLSTSQVASQNQAFMCYGPLTADGYGCCYNPREHDMIFAISSWKSNPETCSDKFSVSLSEALTSMMEVLCQAGEPLKSKL